MDGPLLIFVIKESFHDEWTSNLAYKCIRFFIEMCVAMNVYNNIVLFKYEGEIVCQQTIIITRTTNTPVPLEWDFLLYGETTRFMS